MKNIDHIFLYCATGIYFLFNLIFIVWVLRLKVLIANFRKKIILKENKMKIEKSISNLSDRDEIINFDSGSEI